MQRHLYSREYFHAFSISFIKKIPMVYYGISESIKRVHPQSQLKLFILEGGIESVLIFINTGEFCIFLLFSCYKICYHTK